MSEFLSKEAANRMEIYNLHKSLGILILILISLRIANRLICKAPPLPSSLPKIEKNLTHLAHFTLYFLMILVPLSGYLMSNFFGYPVNFFGIEMPFLVEKNFITGKVLAEIHELSAFTLLGLAVLHILAAFKHRFKKNPEHDVLKRML